MSAQELAKEVLRLRGELALGVSETLARQCPEGEELYWTELEREKARQRERKKRRERKTSARSEKRSARKPEPKEVLEEEEEEIPAEEFVAPAKKDGQVKALEKQLAANRRMSQKLEKTLVQKQMEAKQQQEQKQHEFDVTTSSDSTVEDAENESMATGQMDEDDLPFPRTRMTPRDSIGGALEDSEIEIINENADHEVETKDDIMVLFRTWGGTEAVEAAKAGDAESVQRAIQKQLDQNLSPRSSRASMRDVFHRLQRLQKRQKSEKSDRKKSAPEPKMAQARQRLAVSLAREEDASHQAAQQRSAQGAGWRGDEEEDEDSGSISLVDEDVNNDQSFALANEKIQQILSIKSRMGEDNEEDKDSRRGPFLGVQNVDEDTVENKTAIINDLLLLMNAEESQ